jgi:crossover junction endodeoxyribonuclease RusA
VKAAAIASGSRTWTARLPLPPRELSPNARVHWAARRRAAGAYVLRCLAALREQGVFPPREAWPIVTITAAFYVGQLGDQDNRMASLKALIDALVRAGYFAGDDPGRLTFASVPAQHVVNTMAERRLEITIAAAA